MKLATSCNVSRLRYLFENYSKEIDGITYKKMDYPIWRDLKKSLGETSENKVINIYWGDRDRELKFSVGREDVYFYFPVDQDFGKYLAEHMVITGTQSKFSDKDVAEMTSTLKTYRYPESWYGAKNGYYLTEYSPSFKDDIKINNGIAVSPIEANTTATCLGNSAKDYIDKTVTETLAKMTMEKYNNCAKNECEENKEEKKNMFNFNFDFGPVDGSKIRMSPYGMAVQNRNNVFVSYDAKTGKIMDVDVFNFDGSKFMYKMPVALNAVQKGDIVIHNHKPMFVASIDGTRLNVIDVYEGESKAVIPTTNMFGFDFVTKVVSFIDIVGTPTQDNPFGNMLPFMLMSDGNTDNDFLMIMAMTQMNTAGNMFQNPMFLMAMMNDNHKGNGKDDMLKMMMFSQMFSQMNVPHPFQPATSAPSYDEQMSFMPDLQK